MKTVNTLTLDDAAFPEPLRRLPQPPTQLYYRGSPPSQLLAQPRLAVVGSRKMSAYGRHVTERLVAELAAAGIIIVSGLAFGIDSVAHSAALSAGGKTIAILPGPVDTVYPAAHGRLAESIVSSGGTLMSEYGPGTAIFKHSFIARNRIIAALSDAVLITEAAAGSGSLHTAGFALEQGLPVMAVPGNIDSPVSAGTNTLIKNGAAAVTEAADIYHELGLHIATGRKPVAYKQLEGPQKQLAKLVAQDKHSSDELARLSGLPAHEFFSVMTALELKGIICQTAEGRWLIRYHKSAPA